MCVGSNHSASVYVQVAQKLQENSNFPYKIRILHELALTLYADHCINIYIYKRSRIQILSAIGFFSNDKLKTKMF